VPFSTCARAFVMGMGSVLDIWSKPHFSKPSEDMAKSPALELPDPETLEAYEKATPGLAERIVADFEAKSAHRREQERLTLAAEIRWHNRGQFFGFVLGLVMPLIGAATALSGHDLAGGFIGTGGVIGLVSVFVIGRVWRTNPKQTS
jgi:uncharacterized membrane protein